MRKFIIVGGLLLVSYLITACSSGRILPKIDDMYGNYYEIFVRSFYDSDGDGIGDIKGITKQMTYLNDGDDKSQNDLMIDGLWLML